MIEAVKTWITSRHKGTLPIADKLTGLFDWDKLTPEMQAYLRENAGKVIQARFTRQEDGSYTLTPIIKEK